MQRRDWDFPMSSEEVLKELLKKDEKKSTEIKIENATVTIATQSKRGE